MQSLTVRIIGIISMVICCGLSHLGSQVDTVYSLGSEKNRLSMEEVNQHIERLQSAMENDSIEWHVRYEITHQELENDTLFQLGKIHIIDSRSLGDVEKMEFRLNLKLPEFEFVSMGGDTLSSGRLLGKVVLLNFWFTKCPPCIAEMPFLNRIKNDYRDKNIEFISMAPEQDVEIRDFLKTRRFGFRHIPDAEEYIEKFGIGYPKNILIDKNGIVRYVGGGIVQGIIEAGEEGQVEEHQLSWDLLRIKIDELLSES